VFWAIILKGLSLAGIYFLISFGVTFLYGVGGFPNLAIGPIGLTGAFVAATFIRQGISVPAALFAGLGVAVILGLIIQRYVVEPLYNSVGGGERGRIFVIYGTFGLLLLFPAILINIFPITMLRMRLPRLGSVEILGFPLSVYEILAVVLAVFLLIVTQLALNRTLNGNRVRAVTQNAWLGRLVGIRVRRIYLATAAIASTCAFVGAVLWGEMFNLDLGSGVTFTLYGFMVAVMGGLGSIYGAFLVSLFLGVTLSATSFLIGGVLEYIVTTVLLIVILLTRPMGIVPTRREL
jgi:branched-chain amino acid transport system permease protein